MSEFNLKAVLRVTGLTPETLRAWERRYGAVRPVRSDNGRRLYSSAQMQRLKLLSILVRRGFRIGEIAKHSDVELTRQLEETRESASSDKILNQSRGIADLLNSLERFDLSELRKKIALVRYQISAREFALELTPALMNRIGSLFESGKISIAQEHAVSHLIQNELREIFDSLESLEKPADDGLARNSRPHRMIFGTRPGDFHAIGLKLAAILCRAHGIQCHYLGANLSASSMLDAVKNLKPMAVVVGLSDLSPEESEITPQHYIEALAQGLPKETELWVGGSAVSTLKRPKGVSSLNIFESIHDLESKLSLSFP